MNICILDKRKDEINIIKHNLNDLLAFLDILNNKCLKLQENKLDCNNANLFTGLSIQTEVFKDVIKSFISKGDGVKYEYFTHYMTVNIIQYLYGIFNLFEANINDIYEQVFTKNEKEKHSIEICKNEYKKFISNFEQCLLETKKIQENFKLPVNRKIRYLYKTNENKFNGEIQEKFRLLSKMRNHLYHTNKSIDLNDNDINIFIKYLSEYLELSELQTEEILNVTINEKKHFCFSTTFYNYKYYIMFFIHVLLEIYAQCLPKDDKISI